jgi:hypothetical protein
LIHERFAVEAHKVECFYESVPIGAPVNIRYQVIKGTLRSHHCVTALSFSFFPPPQDGCRFSGCAATSRNQKPFLDVSCVLHVA